MQNDPTGERGSGLEDVFTEAAGATTATVAPAEPPEIEMPPAWAGQGNPPRPQQVRDDIESKTHQAEALRQRAQQLTEQEQKLDGDVNVANQLLSVRTEDHQQLEDRMNALQARHAELEGDARRHDPDVNHAADQVNALKRELGEKVPSDELMPPEGEAPPAPATVETDPTKIVALREQLAQAQAKLDQLVAERGSGSGAELARIKAEQDSLAPQLELAEDALHTQQANVQELKTRAEALENDSEQSLDTARGLEADAKNLTDALPEYQQVWDTWAAEHPDEAKVTDLGTIDVKVPPRETAVIYAQGRREEAGRLEQQATDADKASADAANGAQSRIELAQRNDEEAANITQRVDAATTRAAVLQGQADDANKQAEKLGADADRMTAEAAQLRSQGRTEAADTMDGRVRSMSEASINAKFRADDLERDATNVTESSVADRTRAEELAKQSTTLRSEAVTLTNQESTLQQQATKLREDATTRDHIAQDVEDRLQNGQAFKFQLIDDRMGESVTLDVPAGPPPYEATAPTPTADTGAGNADGAVADASTDTTVADTAATDSEATGDALLGGDDITGAPPVVVVVVAASDVTVDTAGAGDVAAATTDTTPASADDELIAADDTVPASQAFDATDAPAPAFDDAGPSDFSAAEPPDSAAVDASADDGLDA